MTHTIIRGDCIEQMRLMPEASIDAIVTDPPYLIGFMGKEFDSQHKTFVERKSNRRAGSFEAEHGNHNPINSQDQQRTRLAEGRRAQAWHDAWAREALRVLKPGAHLLAFGGTRTYHRLACAIEDAGFEIRDTIAWMYGSGFPKSLDVSKTIDRAAGAEREVIGYRESMGYSDGAVAVERNRTAGSSVGANLGPGGPPITAPATPDAERWQGWGTALAPAHEPIVVARKPLSGTVAATVLQHGTGALNIDGCRIGFRGEDDERESKDKNRHADFGSRARENAVFGEDKRPRGEHGNYDPPGRWPKNVVLDESAAVLLDQQTGERRSSGVFDAKDNAPSREGCMTDFPNPAVPGSMYADSGGASRFFLTVHSVTASDGGQSCRLRYSPKASSAERNAGLDGFEERKREGQSTWAGVCNVCGSRMMLNGKTTCGHDDMTWVTCKPTKNVHPTVKPVDLMRWLVRLVTPPGGLVCDPFAGSGTTGIATVLEGFEFVGIEREAEYADIAEARIAWWARNPPGTDTDVALEAGRARDAVVETGQLGFFGLSEGER